jgi:hypothetical protein
MNARIACVLSAIVGSLIYPLYTQVNGASLPETLAAAIKKTSPGATIVSVKEVDSTSCQSVGDSPGLVRADLNGDGRQDYAVLLKTKVSKEETIWEGKTLHEAQFALMLFLADRDGGFRARTLHRYADFVPTAVVINLQPPGVVRNRETHRTVRVQHPGVTLIYCEKSATTYYLADDKVHSIPIAD